MIPECVVILSVCEVSNCSVFIIYMFLFIFTTNVYLIFLHNSYEAMCICCLTVSLHVNKLICNILPIATWTFPSGSSVFIYNLFWKSI